LEGGLTGIFIGSYLQSVTPGLALGLEAFYQRTAMSEGPDTAISYVAKYKGGDWIGSIQLQTQGATALSYWRRLTEKVEVGADLNLQFVGMGRGAMMEAMRREGNASLGAKYDFHTSTFRAQLDSNGKVSALLEKRVAPTVMLTFAGELDQFKVGKQAVLPMLSIYARGSADADCFPLAPSQGRSRRLCRNAQR
jgi:mitochondrial import receptor subunit TOM40